MHMKNIAVLLFAIIGFSVSAQNKLLTMEDAMVKNRSTLAVENLKQLQRF